MAISLSVGKAFGGKPAYQVENNVLSVVIPTLNEEDGITDIVERIQATRKSLLEVGIDGLEVIVVDDGSTDSTAEIVGQLAGVRLLRHERNMGYGAAIKTGFSHASGEFLAFLDADSTYPPESFADLCRVALEEGADVVVGSRRSGSESSMPFVRKLGNLLWSNLLSLIGSQRVDDPASGMRVVRRSSLERLYPLPDGLNFTPVMSTRALHEGLKFREIPIPYHERSGRSKLTVVGDGTRFLKTIIWTALEYNPARVLELVGLGLLLVSVFCGGSIVFVRLQGVTYLGPGGVLSVYASLLFATMGVSILSLGYSFNYLVALFHHRPIRQVNLGTKLFGPSLERHFGWIGITLVFLGGCIGGTALALGIGGWEITRLWLWLVGSALFILMGTQLTLSWLLMRLLETLNERDGRVSAELSGEKIHPLKD